MTSTLRVLRDFFKYPAAQLVTFGQNVSVNLDPAKFPGLSVAPKDIGTLADTLKAKQAAMITGGTVATAARDKAYDALTAALDTDADVVEQVADGDLEVLLATGYLPASTNRSSSPLDDTAIMALMNNGTTQIYLRLQPVNNAKSYQVQVSADGGKAWMDSTVSTQARRVVLGNLTPGTRHRRQHRGQRVDQPRHHHVHLTNCEWQMAKDGSKQTVPSNI